MDAGHRRGGGVGSAGVQYARALGARVVAVVSSQEKEEAVRRIGAEIVLRTDQIADLKEGLREALARKGLDGVEAAWMSSAAIRSTGFCGASNRRAGSRSSGLLRAASRRLPPTTFS